MNMTIYRLRKRNSIISRLSYRLKFRYYMILETIKDLTFGIRLLVSGKHAIYYNYETKSMIYLDGLTYLSSISSNFGEQAVFNLDVVNSDAEITKTYCFCEFFGVE